MTKLEAIQGLLDGTYENVRSTAFGPKEYLFISNSNLMLHTPAGNVVYNHMSDLDDLSWGEYKSAWYNNIPVTGILVFDSNNCVHRAIGYNNPNILFDDGTSELDTDCSVLNQEEFETLYKANKEHV